MEKKIVFRLIIILALLCIFYFIGMPIEIIAILGILFVALVLLKGKIWRTAEKTIEKYLPFTKKWSSGRQKILLIILFFVIYAILKQIIFFFIGLAGIDLQEMILSANNINTP